MFGHGSEQIMGHGSTGVSADDYQVGLLFAGGGLRDRGVGCP